MSNYSVALTGRHVALMFAAFFAIVTAVNAVMIRAALSTFGGVERQSSYKAGLAFSREIEAASDQDARHWQVEATVRREDGNDAVIITARDARGAPLTGLEPEGKFAHPVDSRRDRPLAFTELGEGRYRSVTATVQGNWDLDFALLRNDVRLFRSKSRLSLQGKP